MSKVLVDREEIEAVRNTLANGGGAVGVLRWAESVLAAQPAEAEGVKRWNGLKLAAEVAEEDGPWEPRLGMTDCETAFAQSASPSKVLELIASLSAVTAERDRLRDALRPFSAFEAVRSQQGGCTPKHGTVWAVASQGEDAEITVEHLQEAVAAMAAKEA
ncbi:hypothetical protein [Stutzerimonas nitrititolerans]